MKEQEWDAMLEEIIEISKTNPDKASELYKTALKKADSDEMKADIKDSMDECLEDQFVVPPFLSRSSTLRRRKVERSEKNSTTNEENKEVNMYNWGEVDDIKKEKLFPSEDWKNITTAAEDAVSNI